MRYFVESYAVMCIPMGFFVRWLSHSRIWIKVLLSCVASFFLFLNLFQTWQFNNWMIDGYAMKNIIGEYFLKLLSQKRTKN